MEATIEFKKCAGDTTLEALGKLRKSVVAIDTFGSYLIGDIYFRRGAPPNYYVKSYSAIKVFSNEITHIG